MLIKPLCLASFGVALLALLLPRGDSQKPLTIAFEETSTAIVGGTLIDGSGSTPLKEQVVIIRGDSIVAVGPRGKIQIPNGARVIDATGMVVAPGFIDAHNHSDRGFADDPSAASQVSQGITTVVIGQDGGSA